MLAVFGFPEKILVPCQQIVLGLIRERDTLCYVLMLCQKRLEDVVGSLFFVDAVHRHVIQCQQPTVSHPVTPASHQLSHVHLANGGTRGLMADSPR
jgi:hypothetical protein